MALEHHDGSVEPGHVQAQVVRPDLLVGRVGENLTVVAQENTLAGTQIFFLDVLGLIFSLHCTLPGCPPCRGS